MKSVFVFLLLLASGCSSPSGRIRVVPSEKIDLNQRISWVGYTRDSIPDKAPDATLWHEALSSYFLGDFTKAETQWTSLLQSQDSTIQRLARKALSEHFFNQYRWKNLLELESTHGAEIDHTLVKAFSMLPEESMTFSDHPAEFPWKTSLTGTPTIQVTVNGLTKTFWIDTGAGLTVLSSDIAEECNVSPLTKEQTQASTGTSKRIDVFPAVIEEFNIGNIHIQNHPCIVIDKKDLEFKLFGIFRLIKIDGIIGWNAIRQMRLEFNAPAKRISLGKPLASNRQRNFFWLGYPFVRLKSSSEIDLLFGLDTGADRTSFSSALPGRLNARVAGTRKARIGSAGGFEQIEVTKVDSLTVILPPRQYILIGMETRPEHSRHVIQLDGTMGSDWLRDANMILDYTAGRFEYDKSLDE